MMIVKTTIKSSIIEGVGVFAAEFIPRGTPIWRLDERFDLVYPSDLVTSFPDHMQEYFDRYGYPHMERDGYTVLEVDNGRFMNHSETPNSNFTQADVGWATADIEVGEEITCNYFEFDKTFRGFLTRAQPVQHVNGEAHA